MLLRLTTAALIAGLPVAAHAQEAAKPAPEARPAPEAKQGEEPKPITRTAISDKLNADYADLDSNKDGKATAEEINARLVKDAEAALAVLRKARDDAFAKLDTNADGTVSRAEFDDKAPLPTVKEPNPKPHLDRFDKDKDGAITLDEFRGPTIANFEKMDLNKDGTLSVAEQKPLAPAKKKPAVKQTPVISR